MHHQWHWGENTTRRRSQGGLTLSCEGQWKAHKFQDDDGQTQTSVSWAGSPPFPPSPLTPSAYRCRRWMALPRPLRVVFCSFASLRLMPFPHEQLGFLLYSSKPSAGLLSSLLPPFEFHSQDRYILLQMSQPVLFLPT